MGKAAIILIDHSLGQIDADEFVRMAVQDIGDGAGPTGVIKDADGLGRSLGVFEGVGRGREGDAEPG